MTNKENIERLDNAIKEYLSEQCYMIWNSIKKDLEEKEKQDKVLEIIFKKNVDIELLKLSTNWLDYHTRVIHRTGKNTELTEEELNLIKEWLEE